MQHPDFVMNLDGNPLQPPFDILSRADSFDHISIQSIKSLVEELQSDSTLIPMIQGKVVLIGDALAGKTSLLRSLNRSNWERRKAKLQGTNTIPIEERTIGIDVEDLKIPHSKREGVSEEDISIRVFDMAGQDHYIASHQLFFSEGSLFVIVFNLTSSDIDLSNTTSLSLPTRLEFWFRSIQCRSPSGRVILVGTHADRFKESDISITHQFMNHLARLLSQHRSQESTFPQLLGTAIVSCIHDTGINQVREMIIGMAKNRCNSHNNHFHQRHFQSNNSLEDFNSSEEHSTNQIESS